MKLEGSDPNDTRIPFSEFEKVTDGCGKNTPERGWMPCLPEECERQDHFSTHHRAEDPDTQDAPEPEEHDEALD
jgi:hypothetical protein